MYTRSLTVVQLMYRQPQGVKQSENHLVVGVVGVDVQEDGKKGKFVHLQQG